jgi:hypothetical protein
MVPSATFFESAARMASAVACPSHIYRFVTFRCFVSHCTAEATRREERPPAGTSRRRHWRLGRRPVQRTPVGAFANSSPRL